MEGRCIIRKRACISLKHPELPTDRDHPLLSLPREDLDFITQLVIASGSLKDLAAAYGVSYPTIRSRLDKLIDRLRAAVENRPVDPLTELVARLVEQGELTVSGARAIQQTARDLIRPAPPPTGGTGGTASDGTKGGAT